jgi:hypothetical protein
MTFLLLQQLVSITILEEYEYEFNISLDTKWKQHGITVAGGNRKGNKLNQLNSPHDVFIDDDQAIYVADCENHRIHKFEIDLN